MSASLIGQILENRYRVENFIGSGGMGDVYRVWDNQRNVDLAMKVLKGDLADDPEILKFFKREANALKALAHPNIVAFYGLHQSRNLVFMLQAYIDGQSLKQYMDEQNRRPLNPLIALTYLKALCAALGYVHSWDLVHCDVKPGNVMVDQGGKIYLADFGIARHADSTTTTLGVAGAPAYMAPEQIRAETLTAATDIYALGVTLYEMLTGRRPFTSKKAIQENAGPNANERLYYAQLNLPIPDPRRFNPDLPKAIVPVLQKALAKKCAERYASAQDLLTAAAQALGVSLADIPDRLPPPKVNDDPDTDLNSSGPDHNSVSESEGEKWVNAVLAVSVLAIVILAFFVLQNQYTIPHEIPGTTVSVTTLTNTSKNALSSTRTPSFSPTIAPTSTKKPSPTASFTPTSDSTQIDMDDGMAIISIPAGEVWVGALEGDANAEDNEKPNKVVQVDAFWIDQTEVTHAMFAAFLNAEGNQIVDGHPIYDSQDPSARIHGFGSNWQVDAGHEQRPVVEVSWHGARLYCEWVGRRLPTEAEWERAARGGDLILFAWGNQAPDCSLANFFGCEGDSSFVGVHPDGASEYGVLDLCGNVWEWVYDWYGFGHYDLPLDNPQGPPTGDRHVMKGGGWNSAWDSLRISRRVKALPYATGIEAGFRCAQDGGRP